MTLIGWWLGWVEAAAACDRPYPTEWFVDGLSQVEAALGADELDRAALVLGELRKTFPCSADQVHPNVLARFGRLSAAASYLDQDEAEFAYWERLADVGDVGWPTFLGPEHPGRGALSAVEPAVSQRLAGRSIAPPKGGALVVDGKILTVPELGLDMPHLVQVFDRSGVLLEGYWQDGLAFQERYLTEGESIPEVPKWYEPPNIAVDASQQVELSETALERRATAERRLAERSWIDEQRKAKVLARQEKRALERAAEAQRIQDAAPAPPLVEGEPSFVGLTFDEDPLAGLSLTPPPGGGCSDLIALEPFALLGRLTEEQTRCLEERVRLDERMVDRDKVSRVLLADAIGKGDVHRWEGLVRRHVEQVDGSDPDLLYAFARHLAGRGLDQVPEAVRFARLALESADRWEGEVRVKRVQQLHQIATAGANALWLDAERQLMSAPSRHWREAAGFWRSQTKGLAKEWLLFALAAGQPAQLAYELCVASAGTQQYCQP